MRKPASANAATIRAAGALRSPRAASSIVFAMIRSTVELSRSDIPFSSCRIPPSPTAGWPGLVNRPYLREMMLDLTEEETDALAKLLSRTIDDRYPLSPRVQTLKGILAKIGPEPAREPLPPPKVYANPGATAARSSVELSVSTVD
jgi:hypothetical protein